MKLNKSFLAAIVIGSAMLTGCADDFAEMNQNPAAVTTPDASYLFAQSVNAFEAAGYYYWFYNAPMLYSWNQMAVPTVGMSTSILRTTSTGSQSSNYIETLRYVRELENYRSTLSEEESARVAAYQSAAEVLTVYLGIFATDMYGNISFTEACRAAYGGTITPAYDTQESLYNLWLEQLDNAITVFQSPTSVITRSQDVVTDGNLEKWAKFANSLKLRIAVRLIAQDAAKARQIASQVTGSSAGYIDSMNDAILFNKAKTHSSSNDYIYHWSNGFMEANAANGRVVDLMVDNLDPRVRFCYRKNSWNSKIVQAYYDRGREIPAFIEENVNYTTDANGRKTFVSWKSPGEPWVRYHGLPVEYNAGAMPQYNWYFNYGQQEIAKEDGTAVSTYRTYSLFQHQMIIGRYYQHSVPTTPEDVVAIPSEDRPWYGLYMGAAEVNLYLAEFAMLDGNDAAAKTHYDKALAFSVQEYDRLAGLNQISYYGTTYGYDPNEEVIDLQEGEIETMMQSDAYAFTGTAEEKLEKIYIQQMLNFTLYPNEQYITARRSGYPKIGSTLLAREAYNEIPVTTIPRRFDTGEPVQTDIMYDILIQNYRDQGFTTTSPGSNNFQILHDERVWSDKGAPEWGAGPNY